MIGSLIINICIALIIVVVVLWQLETSPDTITNNIKEAVRLFNNLVEAIE